VKIDSRPGKALILALFSVALADCGSRSAVHPKQVETSALKSAVTDPQVRAFYEARQWQAAWDAKSEKALLAIIAEAPANGLKPTLFLKRQPVADANSQEAALTAAALRHASALARGFADPGRLGHIYTIPRPKPDIGAGLVQALADENLEQWFKSLPPQTEEYRALSQEHLRYLRMAGSTQAAPITAGRAIKPGRRDPRLAAIAAALVANQYLAPPAQGAARPQTATPPCEHGGVGSCCQEASRLGVRRKPCTAPFRFLACRRRASAPPTRS
jgi:murein L,D-transpeptidase YcbB/YkuD